MSSNPDNVTLKDESQQLRLNCINENKMQSSKEIKSQTDTFKRSGRNLYELN